MFNIGERKEQEGKLKKKDKQCYEGNKIENKNEI